jgi:hypothetical protein
MSGLKQVAKPAAKASDFNPYPFDKTRGQQKPVVRYHAPDL